MRSRSIWIVGAACCALAVAVGYLARPEDELAGAMALHPKVTKIPNSTLLDFDYPPQQVLRTLPLATQPSLGGRMIYDLDLRSKRRMYFVVVGTESPDVQTARLIVPDDRAPWYRRAWRSIRQRLGM